MATVVVTTRNEGAPEARRKVERHHKGQTAKQLLKAKADSHVAHGWTVEWQGKNAFHAWKLYPENDGNPDEPSRKDRFFKIE